MVVVVVGGGGGGGGGGCGAGAGGGGGGIVAGVSPLHSLDSNKSSSSGRHYQPYRVSSK